MTSARVFYGLLTVIVVTGVPASLNPDWERRYVTAWVVAGVLAALVAVARYVATEVRWHRDITRVTSAPATPMATETAAAK